MRKCINPNEYGSLLYNNKEIKYINNVIKQKRIFRYSKCSHPYAQMCEEKLNKILNVKHSLLTTNGTSGLKTALTAISIKPHDRVLISSYTFLATALAPLALGAIPIPIEIDMNNGLDLEDLKKEIKNGCKAIIVVHFQGRAFNLKKVKEIANKAKVPLIEDACQAFGAKYKEKYAGTMGDIGVFSFQQFKQISTGEGGLVVTDNKDYYQRMRNYTDMGSVRDRFPNWNMDEALFGENYRMNNLIAAVLYAQLEKFDYLLKHQKASRQRIMKRLAIKNIVESNDPNGDTCMNILLLLNNKNQKEKAIEIGKEMNIELRNMWSGLYYDNELFRKNKLDAISLKNRECIKTTDIISRMLVISIPPTLTKKEELLIVSLFDKLKESGVVD